MKFCHQHRLIGGVLVSTGILKVETAIRSANCVIKAKLKNKRQ